MTSIDLNTLSTSLWAKSKPYKSLIHHMIDVGTMAQALLVKSCMAPVRQKLKEWFNTDEKELLLWRDSFLLHMILESAIHCLRHLLLNKMLWLSWLTNLYYMG